ncbi:hypothetical protein BDP55DRAFT_632109 [Colletotrichum godetiae]|uniref:Uncharacterized protein n=1 Tax=Colletotrichum godetiae TaxID=1209918 RepID=A0AAJ0AN58_9PEZI|nr:uncharacterized protein BDP55DRAFT_632109 [Colletotrichum godetiae]KAK1675422.1 hypothetical protein BDP55DRAFT_632109 [Colletotrichum godetiae]
MSESIYISQSIRSGFEWPQRFSEKDAIAKDSENKPWLACQEEFNSSRDAISVFLEFDDDDVRYHGRVSPVLDICQNLCLHDLSHLESPNKDQRVAWLIDGQLVDEEINFRECLGFLTASQLTEALLKPALTTDSAEQDMAHEMIISSDEIPRFDAERRLLQSFWEDLSTSTCVLELRLEYHSWRDFSLKAGNFDPVICAKRYMRYHQANGPQNFSLEFYLPFRVWRKTKHLIKDERIKISDNEPLRSSRDVPYLMPPGNGDEGDHVHGIYSGHIACAVSGHDHWRWTAYFAIDTWFDENEGMNEQVTRYDNDREDGFEWDPCSEGQDDAKKPHWYPRIWFPRIFGIRLDQIKDEWESICLHLGQNLDREDRKYNVLLQKARRSPEHTATKQHMNQINALWRSVLESRDVLQDLISAVQETVKVGASFLSTEVNFFLNFDGKPGDASVLPISYSKSDWKATRPVLEERLAFKSITDLELIQMRLKNGQLLAIGPGDVGEVRVLAFSTLLTRAFSQTTALFSADGVIAFTKNWQTFLISLLVAYGINLTIGSAFLMWIRRARRKVQNLLRPEPVLPVMQPTPNFGAAFAVTLRSSSEIVSQGISTHVSSTSFNDDGAMFHSRRRLSDRLWVRYRRTARVDDVELGDRNVSVVEELT